MGLLKATDILSGSAQEPKSPAPQEERSPELGDALEEAGFSALAGHPGIRRRGPPPEPLPTIRELLEPL